MSESVVNIIEPKVMPKVHNGHLTTKKRVAAYCRVSTDDEMQETSFKYQVDEYTRRIKENPDYELANIYSDKGKSGTNTIHRNGFNSLMEDARNGLIDLILTKSVSRFARNTLSTVHAIRELKALNVEVYFENESMSSLDPKSEFMLTLMTSMAQEEARHVSENINWTYQKKFREGKPVINHTRFLGYTKDKDGNLVIEPNEAIIVKEAFNLYISGIGPSEIVRMFEEKGYKTGSGSSKWSISAIQGLLRNEKYVGDLIQQKTYTVDYLTHQTKKNKGERTMFISKDVLPAIIDRTTWNKTQEIIASRRNGKRGADTQSDKYLRRYPLSGKIICAKCGHTLKRRIWNYGKTGERVHLLCGAYIDRGKQKCPQKGICLDGLVYALNDAIKEYLVLSDKFDTPTNNVDSIKILEEINQMKKSLSGLLDRILYSKTEYEKDVLNDKYEEYSIALEKKIKEFNNLKNNVSFVSISSERLKILKEYVGSEDSILTKEIVEAFIVAGIEIDSENVIFIVSNSTNIKNAQIASSREDIMKMPGIIEKTTVCKKGIKTYTVNYRVVVL